MQEDEDQLATFGIEIDEEVDEEEVMRLRLAWVTKTKTRGKQ